MIILIASYRTALLLYCLPPSYNFIFTIDYGFLIRFRPEPDDHSIIFSPVNLLCPKKSWVNLDILEGALSCINIHFPLKLQRLKLVPCKESLTYKIVVVSTVQFNFDFDWSNNVLIDNFSPYHHTTISLLPLFGHKKV